MSNELGITRRIAERLNRDGLRMVDGIRRLRDPDFCLQVFKSKGKEGFLTVFLLPKHGKISFCRNIFVWFDEAKEEGSQMDRYGKAEIR
ncbi:MAG: hypothetical protein M1426_06285 [Patescibacteria group bacterium]|nr:hypothetical protein [Patescibacteria group bacterium]